VGKPDDEARERARAAEEQAWRDIVDNYGERPDVAPLVEVTRVVPEPEADQEAEPGEEPWDDDAFTPPPLPPPAVITPERRLAWVGLVGSPVLLVLLNLLHYALPGILTFGLVVAFIASFGYLVATMAPRDPDDDGAVV
jgi:hypothetical protein